MEKCVPANFTRSRQARLLAVVPVRRRVGGREGGRAKRKRMVSRREQEEGERQEEGKEKERRAEEEANDEEDRAKAGRSPLQLRERCTQASDGGRIGGRGVDTGGGFKCVTKEVNL